MSNLLSPFQQYTDPPGLVTQKFLVYNLEPANIGLNPSQNEYEIGAHMCQTLKNLIL